MMSKIIKNICIDYLNIPIKVKIKLIIITKPNIKKKILFIDLDPQFNTTQSLINEFDLEDEYMNEYSSGDNNKTVMKLFQSQLTLAKKVDIPTPDDVLVKLNDNMDFLPGTINLILVESDKDGTKARKVKSFINEN